MRLVDSHAHLQAAPFRPDLDAVIGDARATGVERILSPGWDVPSSRASIELAERHGTDAAVGVHPHAAAEVDAAAWAGVEALARERSVVAIGETGLDYDRAFAPREAQLENLRRNLALALATGKPAILHCRSRPGRRDAQDELIAELRAAGFGGPRAGTAFGDRAPAILHSFSGPLDYAEAALELGLAVSFSGLVFRSGEEGSREVAALVPGERLLVETDCPYLAPPGAPKRRNEPRWVAVTAGWVADARGETVDELGAGLVAAYDAVFGRRR